MRDVFQRGVGSKKYIDFHTRAGVWVRVDLPKSPHGFTPTVSFFLCSKKVLRASS